ncbi:MAG: cyclase family protein [Acidobacteriota bacterium]|jgi:arylformamidase
MPIYDISQTIDDRIVVWPGDQKFRHRWSMRIEKGDSCNVSAVTMSVHTGTHLDAPYHFDDAAHDVGSVPLQPCMGPARVVAVPAEERRISEPYLARLDWKGVERILFRTRSGESGGDRFERDFVCLAEDGAEFLAAKGLRLVGTDAPSVDAFTSKSLPCHKILNEQGIAILEGVRLAHTPPGDYELICLPLKLSGLDGSPVRAVLRRPD